MNKLVESIYKTLAKEANEDARPLFALALLKYEVGDNKQTLSILRKTQKLNKISNSKKAIIDQLAIDLSFNLLQNQHN